MPDRSKFVYSTDPDWKAESGAQEMQNPPQPGETAGIQRDRKNRKGKTVTVITGLSGDLRPLQKDLQKLCGAGGSLKNGQIEIQGDHRDKIADYLRAMGFRIKFIGG